MPLIEDRGWKIEDGRLRMEDRLTRGNTILDPQSSILDRRLCAGSPE
jgi:hypothetical protein